MKRAIFTYGVISGLVIIISILVSIEIGEGHAWLGYLVMLIAFSVIFFAIKQHRDETLGGSVSFLNASLMGVGISTVAGLVYAGVWELYLAATDYRFIEDYVRFMVDAKEQAGASEAELDQFASDAGEFIASYRNPVNRLPMTFMEVFPVGFLVSIGSAAFLSNQRSVD